MPSSLKRNCDTLAFRWGNKPYDLGKPSLCLWAHTLLFPAYPVIMNLLLAHLLPFHPLLLHEASPASSPSSGSSGSSQVTSLPPQAPFRLLSLFLPVYHRLPYFFLSGSHLCLCLSGVSLSLVTCYQRPCFISPFLLSLKWHKGMGLLGLSLFVGPGNSSHPFGLKL